MSKCRACGAEIFFVKTKSGKAIPCDAALIPYWLDKTSKEKVVTLDGEVVSCRFDGAPEEIHDVGRIPHWGTCTNPDAFRRR